jgi:hypothetical protein
MSSEKPLMKMSRICFRADITPALDVLPSCASLNKPDIDQKERKNP